MSSSGAKGSKANQLLVREVGTGHIYSFKPPFFFWGTYVSLKKWELSLETNGRFPYAQGHQDDLRLGPALHRVSPSCLQYLHGGGGPMFQEGAMGDDG